MRLSYAKRGSDAISFSKDQIAEKTAASSATSQSEPKQCREKPRIPSPNHHLIVLFMKIM
jgi:hypothetical protein